MTAPETHFRARQMKRTRCGESPPPGLTVSRWDDVTCRRCLLVELHSLWAIRDAYAKRIAARRADAARKMKRRKAANSRGGSPTSE